VKTYREVAWSCKVAIGGHSIGGNLAVGVSVRLRDKGAPLPAAILAVSPFFDFELKNPTVDGNAETDKLLSRPLSRSGRTRSPHRPTARVRRNRRSPVAGPPDRHTADSLRGVIAHACTAEPAVTEELQKRAALDVTLHPIPGGQHSFILGAGRVPEADQAIQEAGRWLRSKLGLAAALDAQAPSMHGYLRVRHTRFVSGQQSPQSNLDQETDSRVDLTS
jgi:monoterpene epsilon-lactone hydrolase